MRNVILMLMASVALIATRAALADSGTLSSATGLPSDKAGATQTAVWEPRKIPAFTRPLIVNSETQGLREASCDQLYDGAKFLLMQLGARASDFKVDQRNCDGYAVQKSIEVSFSVLALPDSTIARKPAAPVDAHWETVALKGDCAFLQYATKVILPMFTARNVKLISLADCSKIGVGLYAQVLKPVSDRASAP